MPSSRVVLKSKEMELTMVKMMSVDMDFLEVC
jgi:hypothetical protein